MPEAVEVIERTPVEEPEDPVPAPERITKEPVPVLSSSSAKSYMDYRAITDKSSKQWKFINESGEVEIDKRGFITTCDGYYAVALGSYFGEIGQKYIFTLRDGDRIRELRAVKAEAKADKDTRADGFACPDGHVIEMVIDTSTAYMQERKEANGYICSGNLNKIEELRGEIIKIEKIKEH